MLGELWSFMRDDAGTHPLARMAAGRHQFESIHPFADGNGRTGRLINMLYLSLRSMVSPAEAARRIPTVALSSLVRSFSSSAVSRRCRPKRSGCARRWRSCRDH